MFAFDARQVTKHEWLTTDFQSSASPNSATPALGDRSERIRDSRASSTSPRWRVRCPQRVLFARKDALRSGQRTLQQIEPSQTERWPENFAKNNCVAQTGRRCKQRGDVCSWFLRFSNCRRRVSFRGRFEDRRRRNRQRSFLNFEGGGNNFFPPPGSPRPRNFLRDYLALARLFSS